MSSDKPADDAQRQRNAELFRQAFSVSPAGRAVLVLLEKRFAKPPLLTGTQEAVLLTYVRAAQREVLDWIHTQIAIAESDNKDTPQAQEIDP